MTSALTRSTVGPRAAADGFSLLLGELVAVVQTTSLADAVELSARAATAAGPDAQLLRFEVRPDQVRLVVGDPVAPLTERHLHLVQRLAGLIHARPQRTPQSLEIAIDALDIPAILPFWRAVLQYADDGPRALVDPTGSGPSFWFQQMDAPRPQRNRIHLDLTVSEAEAPGRLRAALDAGGRLVSDAEARAFWILADAEGNEVCLCTWQDRD